MTLLSALRSTIAGAVIAFAAAAVLWFLAGTMQGLGISAAHPPSDSSITLWSIAVGLVLGTATYLAQRPLSEPWARVAARAALVFILVLYGVSKLLRTQFRLPYSALDTPLGDASGYALTWRFFGYAYGYEVFVAAGQLAGAALLLFWRTTTLGACVLAVILANIVTVNVTHDLPVQAFSAGLLGLAVYLVAFDLRRLTAVFFANRTAEPQPIPTAGGRWATGWPAVAFGLLALAHAVLYVSLLDSVPTPINGGWVVFRSKPVDVGWDRVYFERGFKGTNPGSVVRGGTRERFRYEIAPAEGRLRISFNDRPSGDGFDATYVLRSDGTLMLTGRLAGHPIELHLTRRR